jgi:molybdopterin biosynthesis enzyme
MAGKKPVAGLDHTDKEGHGEDAAKPTVKKGTFIGVGTYAPLANTADAISPNKKSGTSSGDFQ